MQLQSALLIADTIISRLAYTCTKIDIAGSIRRQQPEVKDIEILCQPKNQPTTDLFGSIFSTERSHHFIKVVNDLGHHIKGKAADGRHIQIALPVSPGSCPHELEQSTINLDLFIPNPPDYYRQLAIRTGSADYAHKVIAAAWLKKGWCGVPETGLRKIEDCVKRNDKWMVLNPNAEHPPIWQSEAEFFQWLGIPHLPPPHRQYVPHYLTQ